MKKNRKLSALLAAFAVVLLVSVTGCEKPGEGPNDPIDNGDFYGIAAAQEFENFEIIDPAEELANVSEPTMELEMEAEEITPDFRDNPRHGKKPPRRTHPLLRVFRAMEIDREQFEQIQDFKVQYHRCMYEVMVPYVQARREIIRQANEDRREVITAYRNGSITAEEARAQMKEIWVETHEQLRGLFDWDAKCACLKQFFENIASVLDEDQLKIWNEFINSLEGPCFDEEEPV